MCAGNVYCAVSPYSLEEGAIILAFDSGGGLKRRLRCDLPVSDDWKHLVDNRNGRMLASRIGVNQKKLAIVSEPELAVALYSIGRR